MPISHPNTINCQIMSKSNSMEVIGAGWGRTGTSSMKKALEILGYDPCYHMSEVVANQHVNFWWRVANKKTYDFDEVFASKGKVFTAGVDVPSALFWKEQLVRYPNAKVILNIRDPEKWYKSFHDTILQTIPGSSQCNWARQLAS